MNQEKFVEIIKEEVTNSAIKGLVKVLSNPPGRRPDESLVKLSEFYNQFGEDQKQKINEIISMAVNSGVFGFLCILDGVRSINESFDNRGSLKLSYINGNNGAETILNDEQENYLHDI